MIMNKYLLVNKKILPDKLDKVLETRTLIEEGSVKNISEAVKQVGISRSTYYKYKDFVFEYRDKELGQKAVMAIMLRHKRGVLANVINYISSTNVNILTINQTIPVNAKASVNLSLDFMGTQHDVEEIIENIRKIDNVISVNLLAIE